MVTEVSVLDLKYVLLMVFAVVLYMPFSSNKKIRYYGCYIFYVFYISSVGLFFVPIFMLRPRNVLNLSIAGYVFKPFTKVLGIRWHLKNGDILGEKRGAVIVANHQSILDIMGMWNIWDVMGRCTAIAKKEIIYVFPFGPVGWLAGLVYIDRKDPKKANETIRKTTELVTNEKTKLWFYAEGTRNHKAEELLPFKKGAFRTAIECQVPIIPLVFSPYYFIDSRTKTFDKGDMFITALEPIPTENLTIDDIDSLLNLTHERMSKEYQRLRYNAAGHKKKLELR